MEYMIDFVKDTFDTIANFFVQLIKALFSAAKESDKNKLMDANENEKEKKLPESIRNKQSKDNMDISIENFNKLSPEKQQEYVNNWNSLTEEQRQTRRNEFVKTQTPVMQKAINDYITSRIAEEHKDVKDLMPAENMDISNAKFNAMSKAEKEKYRKEWNAHTPEEKEKLREAYMNEHKAEIDKAAMKYWTPVAASVTAESGNTASLFPTPSQIVPKRVRDEMAVELQGPNGREPLPVSNGRWEKMSSRQKMNFLNSWNMMTPQQKLERLDKFQQQALPNVESAWAEYENKTGMMRTDAANHAFSYSAQQNLIQGAQKAGLQWHSTLNVQQPAPQQNPQQQNTQTNPQQNTQRQNTQSTPQQNHQPMQQSFGGHRRENNNQSLNYQVNNLQGSQPAYQQQVYQQPGYQQPMQNNNRQNNPSQNMQNSNTQQFSNRELDENYEKFQERKKAGGELHRKKAQENLETQRQNSHQANNGDNVLNNNRQMVPNNH